MSGYAELHCLSNFSFQRGASSALELFERAKALGYAALAITDECTLSGIVRAWQAARQVGLPLLVGSELTLDDGLRLVLLVENLAGYESLCALITRARRRAPKGRYQLTRADLTQPLPGLLAIWLPGSEPVDEEGAWLKSTFVERLWIGVELLRSVDDSARLAQLQALGERLGLPGVACGDVHMHSRGRRALQDVLTAIRHHLPVAEAGYRLHPNGERHLRPLAVLEDLYPSALRAATLEIAARCRFDLAELRYQYPHEVVPAGETATSWLAELTRRGLAWRWPEGVPDIAASRVALELALIAEKGYENYFLTVHDIVDYARHQHILCQGRGSAANSVVCYALGITELSPLTGNLLFERFISRERNEPPDIDVDFEHERREEVIQYVFRRYGRERAALTAVVSTYHAAGALRDVGKALGLPGDQLNALSGCAGRWTDEIPGPPRLREAGFDPDSPLLQRVLILAGQLIGFPRHLSQHPGGFVISEAPLATLVPVENAAMAERTLIQWDKDDLDAVGLLKVDILALGMLSALRRCFDLVADWRGQRWTLASLPQEDKSTYRMISRADTVGVFQIESRAQMAMLPRLRPRTLYDLVIEVAIVRPGPIQGDMVHPYLRRRNGEEEEEYPHEELRPALERTLGVPLFQEQVMQIAIIAAEYTPGEADQLRRSMAAWKRHGGLEPHRKRLHDRMVERGYRPEFAARLFEQIKGFGSYGFPESHAASFALLTYASSWLKCHEPAAFACALVNSWPMGFYSPDQVLQDARRHGVEVRAVDVQCSDWDCRLEAGGGPQPAIRLGLRLVEGLAETVGRRLVAARGASRFKDVEDLCRRADLDNRARGQLADAGALADLAGDRHQARWAMAGVERQLPLFAAASTAAEERPELPAPSVAEEVHADYRTLGTTLGPHPLLLLRGELQARRCRDFSQLSEVRPGALVRVAGLVRGRQRPGTASGVIFVTLEDEHGMLNVVVWRAVGEQQRRPLLQARLLQVEGHLEREAGVQHLIAGRLTDLTPLLDELMVSSRDFH